MKFLLALLLTCSLARSAVQDDIARAFLAGVVAQGAVPILTNMTVLPVLNTRFIISTNPLDGAAAGGLVYYNLSQYTNLNGLATLTNLGSVIIPGNTLTNNGDRLRADWSGTMRTMLAGTNRFTISYGSATVLDTGLQLIANNVFDAEVLIVRNGNSSQHVEAHIRWGVSPLLPTLWFQTNVNLELTLDNGVSRRLALNGAARHAGAHTNNGFRVYFEGLR